MPCDLDLPEPMTASRVLPDARRARPLALVVEDSATLVCLFRRFLAARGCDVLVAHTLAEGLALLESGPDYAILDLMLPDGDGEAILRKIRDERRPIRVAVMTASADACRLVQVALLNPDVLISKPIDADKLARGLNLPD